MTLFSVPPRLMLLTAASTVLAVSATLSVGTSPTSAAVSTATSAPSAVSAAPSVEQDLQDIVREAETWKPLSEEATSAAVGTWTERSGGSASGLQLDVEAAKAFRTSGGTVLRIPFASSAGVLPQSNLSAVIGGNTVLGWSEMVLTPRSADSGRLRTWVDGTRRIDRIVEATAPVVRSSWWSRVSWGRSGAGGAAWGFTALSIACSAACVVTAGVGCIACLTAASAVTSGTISFCAGKASRG
jgi:hypothetical protein